MLKPILAAAALVLLAGAARADETIATQQICFTVVDTLAQSWENHKYASKAEADKIGAGLANLETQCKSNQLAAAQKTAMELKPLINR